MNGFCSYDSILGYRRERRVEYYGTVNLKLFKGRESRLDGRELALYISLLAPPPSRGVYALDVRGGWWSLRPWLDEDLWCATRIMQPPSGARLNSATVAALQRAAKYRLEKQAQSALHAAELAMARQVDRHGLI